ncbi:MAG: DUF1318 domain-containing protein [Phycisphaerae bacterium]
MKILQCVLSATVVVCLGGCLQTHNDVVISQPKPLEVNVNLNGKLTLVVQDAQNDMDFIAGRRSPTAAGTGAATTPSTLPVKIPATTAGKPSSCLVPPPRQAGVIFADAASTVSAAEILRNLRADFAENHRLLAAHLVGEAHSGYMEVRGALTNTQQAFVAHDNRWRKRLYELRAAQTGQSMATIGLIYFKIRLKFVPPGAWVQQYDKSTGQWVWVHWK